MLTHLIKLHSIKKITLVNVTSHFIRKVWPHSIGKLSSSWKQIQVSQSSNSQLLCLSFRKGGPWLLCPLLCHMETVLQGKQAVRSAHSANHGTGALFSGHRHTSVCSLPVQSLWRAEKSVVKGRELRKSIIFTASSSPFLDGTGGFLTTSMWVKNGMRPVVWSHCQDTIAFTP